MDLKYDIKTLEPLAWVNPQNGEEKKIPINWEKTNDAPQIRQILAKVRPPLVEAPRPKRRLAAGTRESVPAKHVEPQTAKVAQSAKVRKYIDDSAAEDLKYERDTGEHDEEELLRTLRETLQAIHKQKPDIQLSAAWKSYQHFEDFIIKQAKSYLRNGNFTKTLLKEYEKRADHLLMKVPLKRKNRYGKMFKYVWNRPLIAHLAQNIHHPQWSQFSSQRDRRENAALARTADDLIKFGVLKPLYYCPFESRTLSKETGKKEKVETPSFQATFFCQQNKKGNTVYKCANFCALCYHKRTVAIPKRTIDKLVAKHGPATAGSLLGTGILDKLGIVPFIAGDGVRNGAQAVMPLSDMNFIVDD